MKVKIISDGTPKGTTVIDAESGKLVDDCYAFSISGNCMHATVPATIFCRCAQLAYEGDAEVIDVPAGLKSLAQRISDELNDRQVRRALQRLLGIQLSLTASEIEEMDKLPYGGAA